MGGRGLQLPRDTYEERGSEAGAAPTAHLQIPRSRLLPTRPPRRLRPLGSHGLAATLTARLILHAGSHARRRQLGRVTGSLPRRQVPKVRFSPLKNYQAPVPAAAATQTPSGTSHFRERAASARRAGAVGERAERERRRRQEEAGRGAGGRWAWSGLRPGGH